MVSISHPAKKILEVALRVHRFLFGLGENVSCHASLNVSLEKWLVRETLLDVFQQQNDDFRRDFFHHCR